MHDRIVGKESESEIDYALSLVFFQVDRQMHDRILGKGRETNRF